MIEAKGTWEEWFEIAKQIEIDAFHGTTITSAIMIEFERRGFISKPKWEQAYDDAIKLANSNGCGISDKFNCAMNAVRLMHDRIIELEKIIEKNN